LKETALHRNPIWILPVTGKSFAAAKLALRAEDVNRRGLLPEGSLRAHGAGGNRRKGNPGQVLGRVTSRGTELEQASAASTRGSTIPLTQSDSRDRISRVQRFS